MHQKEYREYTARFSSKYFLIFLIHLPSRQDGEELDPWNDGEALEHRRPEEYLMSSHLFPSLTFNVFANV